MLLSGWKKPSEGKARYDKTRQDNHEKTICTLSNTLLGQRPSEFDFIYCLVKSMLLSGQKKPSEGKARCDKTRRDNQKTTCTLSNTLLGQRPSEFDFIYCLGKDVFCKVVGSA